MDLYNNLKEAIDDLKEIKCQLNIPIKILNIALKNIPYPDILKNIIYKNPELSLKILNRYNDITKIYIDDEMPFETLMDFLNDKLKKKKNSLVNNKKEEYEIDLEIYNYLVEQNFFQKCFNNSGVDNIEITKEDIINYKLKNENCIKNNEIFNWRKNQLDAISHINEYGFTTGIHCQATGCGKTLIILKYIDLMYKLNSKCKIILFTERISILADLFDFVNLENKLDSKNVKFWKDNEICDITKFNVIDRVTVKKSDWIEQLNGSEKSTLLIINRAYLTLNENYKNINGLNLILHDESHNVSSNKCYNFLKYIKSTKENIPIIGFSATPLRAGKTKTGDEMILNSNRLCEIYGNNDGKLNLITNYNMIYSISEQLILPPKFHWFDIESYQLKNKEFNNNKKNQICQISKPELGSVMKILDELMVLMPNRKLVAWCGTIPLCDEWYKMFKEYKDMYSNLKNMKLYKDYSKKIGDDTIMGYKEFKYLEMDGIIFCAQKHREGSDIYKLDGCIFLDKVKNRGAIPFIQSIGRVLRLDVNKSKNCGYIIDGVMRDDEKYEKNIVDKILGYYFALSDLANLNDFDDSGSSYSKYVKLMEIINFDFDEKIIKLKLNKTVIEINCKKLDWKNIIKNFESILEKKVNLDTDDKLKAEFENLKKKALKIGIKNNFKNLIEIWKNYALKKNLLTEPNITYNKFWKGWYDFYQIDVSKFPKTKKEWLNKCKKIKANYKNYKKLILKFDYLPEIPEDIYQDFKNLKNELNCNETNLIL